MPDHLDTDLEEQILFKEITASLARALYSAEQSSTVRRLEQEAEYGFRTIFDHTGTAMFITPESGVVSLVNRQFEALTGYSKEEVENKKYWYEFFAGEDVARMRNIRKGRMAGSREVPEQYECCLVDRWGRVRYLLKTAGLIPGTKTIVASLMDITDRKRAEAEKREAERRAQLASRLATVGQMASGVAHEINNPITGIIGFAGLLMQQDLPEDVREYVETIHEAGRRVATIVEGLLTFARRQPLKREQVDVNQVVEAALKLERCSLQNGKVRAFTDLDRSLPCTMADAGQLQQVMHNIIRNAETEIRLARGEGALVVRTEALDRVIRVVFEDDGPGVPDENMERLFDPFFTTRDIGEGTGLGLSICHGIVSEHGGRIYARNNAGGGATFVVELPVVAASERPEPGS
jgi:PAS domain S-box-containing protein